MNIRQLNCFVAVAEERNVSRAAKRLSLSQPPLTRHIKSLEEGLGVELFTRTSHGMELTQAGESLLEDARHVLGMLQQTAERVRRAAKGQEGHLDIGLYGSATFGVIPRLLRQFKDSHPDVELRLHYAQTPAQIPALRQGRVLIVFERYLPTEPDIEVEHVSREPFMLAVSERHRLAGHKRIEVASLQGERLLIGSSPTMAAATVELCRRHGFEPQFAPLASDVVMSSALAAIGCGVALVPASMARVQFPGIVYVPLQSKAEAFTDLHCFYLRKTRSPLLRSLLDTIAEFRAQSLSRRPGQGCY